MRTSPGLRISWSTYLKRLILGMSYHCGLWTLILCAGTLYPWIHQCVARTKVMVTLLLTYPHVFEYGFCHFFARQLAILFRVAVASTLSSPSIEANRGQKCQRCWRQASIYIFFFSHSASCRQFSGVFAEWDLAYVFTTLML